MWCRYVGVGVVEREAGLDVCQPMCVLEEHNILRISEC